MINICYMHKPYKSISSVLDQSQLESNTFNFGEKGMIQCSLNHKINGEEVNFKRAQDALVALNTFLVRGNKSTKGCIGIDRSRIINLVNNFWKVNNLLTLNEQRECIRYLIVLSFNKRDIRGKYGGGERTLSYWLIIELAKIYPNTIMNLLEELPNIGSWLDFKYIYGICCEDLKLEKNNDIIEILEKIKKKLINIQIDQLYADELEFNTDIETQKKLSLLAKWFPKQGSEYSRKYKIDKEVAKKYYPFLWKKDFRKACKELRKLISKLNTAIGTTEKMMCSKQFSLIKFELVPGRCLNLKHKAWLDENKNGIRKHENDVDRDIARENYINFLEKVKLNKFTSKGKSMLIHELVNEILSSLEKYGDTENFKIKDRERYILLNSQFNDHFMNIYESSDNNLLTDCVFQVDVSGSMKGDPMGASVGIGVLGSSLTSGIYRNRLITFEESPRWIILEYPKNYNQYNYTYPGYRNNTYPLGKFNPLKINKDLDWIEKVAVTLCAGWGRSTNFISALEIVSDAAQLADVKMPKNIFCITDMQWDTADSSYYPTPEYRDPGVKSLFNSLLSLDKKTTYLKCIDNIDYFFNNTYLRDGKTVLGMPKFTVWNVRGNQNNIGFLTDISDPRVQMISGFSTSVLKLFLKYGELNEKTTSWDNLKEILDSDDYLLIKSIINNSKEGVFGYNVLEKNIK